MEAVLISGLLMAFYIIVFMALGSLITRFNKKEPFSFTLTIIVGFFVYYALFQVVAIPFILAVKPLSTLSIVWMGILGVLIILSIFLNHKNWAGQLNVLKSNLTLKNWMYLVPILLTVIQIIIIGMHYSVTADSAYYVGNVTTSVYTDSMNIIHPYTGEVLAEFNLRYLPATLPINDAVFSQVFHIHPLLEVKTVLASVVVIVTNMVVYNLARILFIKKRIECTAWAMFFFFLINYYYNSQFTPAGFYYNRTYEGKAIVANTLILMGIYAIIRLYKVWKDKFNWVLLFVIAWSGNAISMSSVIILPLLLSAGIGAVFIIRKDLPILVKYLVVMIPCLFGVVYYFAYSAGLFVLPIHR